MQASVSCMPFHNISTMQQHWWVIKHISLYRSCLHALGILNLSMDNPQKDQMDLSQLHDPASSAICSKLYASMPEHRKQVANFSCDDDCGFMFFTPCLWLFCMWQQLRKSLDILKNDKSLTGLGADAWHSPSCAKFHFLCSWPKRRDPHSDQESIWSGKKVLHRQDPSSASRGTTGETSQLWRRLWL